ncbi:DegT/DnrJ/EryC1/StrS family aminotransferase [Planktomarina temperata]|nr:DegT/DnrJ/EryC1/StrS family aminotransferase [Planktomarina temperata]
MIIRVSKPHLPNRQFLDTLISDIYANNWLTNSGPLERRFKEELSEYFSVESVALVCNATTAIESLISAISIEADTDIITTPFSFKATSSAVVKNKLTPVYCDIVSESDVRMDPKRIPHSNNILLDTHVYGIPSLLTDNPEFEANRVIFDAAHCFDVFLGKHHISTKGLASVISLHATKMVSSIEGGVIISKDVALLDDIQDRSNFALRSNDSRLAGNHKVSELHAAYGIACLKELKFIISQRSALKEMYDEIITKAPPTVKSLVPPSLSYYPIMLNTLKNAKKFKEDCGNQGIEVRQYFDVALNTIYSDKVCANAESLSGRIICLPMSSQFNSKELKYLSEILPKMFANVID